MHHPSEELPRQYVAPSSLTRQGRICASTGKNRVLTIGDSCPAHRAPIWRTARECDSNLTHASLYDCPMPSVCSYMNTCVLKPTYMNHIYLTQIINLGPERAQKNVRNDVKVVSMTQVCVVQSLMRLCLCLYTSLCITNMAELCCPGKVSGKVLKYTQNCQS